MNDTTVPNCIPEEFGRDIRQTYENLTDVRRLAIEIAEVGVIAGLEHKGIALVSQSCLNLLFGKLVQQQQEIKWLQQQLYQQVEEPEAA